MLNKIKRDLNWEGWEEFLKWQYRSIHVLFDKRFFTGGWDWILGIAFFNRGMINAVGGHYGFFKMCPIEWIISAFLRITAGPFWLIFYYMEQIYFRTRYIWYPQVIYEIKENWKVLMNWAEIPKWLDIDRKREQRWQETLNKVNKRKGRKKCRQ